MAVLNDLYQARIDAGEVQDDEDQRAALIELQRLYDALTASRPAGLLKILENTRIIRAKPLGGVYLYGPVGRGKSMVMDLFFQSLPDHIPRRRVHFHEFMIEIHGALHQARLRGKAETALMDIAAQLRRDLRILCFDEFHVVDVADAMILSRLFSSLLDQGLAVVMTSNWEPERLYEGGLQRDRFLPFITLVKERMDVVSLAGKIDYRMRILEENGVYRFPLGEAAQHWADHLFTELSSGATVHTDHFTVKGREIEVRAVADGIARFGFSQLCERPLGAEDYLAIAQRYHTVFLESVPKLRYDRRNEAKRLMSLVDALYEHGARLVITADASPDRLYFGHDHGFEFQRTVSRLIEMQGKEWQEKAIKRIHKKRPVS